VAAAGAAIPARWGGSVEGRHGWELSQVPGTVGEGLVGGLAGPAGSSPWRPANGAAGGLPAARPARGERHPLFKGSQGAG
jgi:hypothetical protein